MKKLLAVPVAMLAAIGRCLRGNRDVLRRPGHGALRHSGKKSSSATSLAGAGDDRRGLPPHRGEIQAAWLGLRQVVELEIRRRASPAPAQIGELFGLVGEKDLMKRVDARRGVAKGSSAAALERIVKRRNLIAHMGDRKGRGRAAITIDEVASDLDCVAGIISALDTETRARAALGRSKAETLHAVDLNGSVATLPG